MVDNLRVGYRLLTEPEIGRIAEGPLRPVGDTGGAALRDPHLRTRPEKGFAEVGADLTRPEHYVDALGLHFNVLCTPNGAADQRRET